MSGLRVDPTYLAGLAKILDNSAKSDLRADLAEANKKLVDMSWDMWWTHGPACGDGNIAVSEVAALRSAVIAGLDAMAQALAVCLNDGSTAYLRTDEEAGDNLGRQMIGR